MSLRRKLIIVLLALYWPTLFVLAHIPIPQVVYEARVSDKSLHFLAYLILTFLLWFAVSPSDKVRLRSSALWWVIIAVICYSAVDEITQAFVGRMCDLRDFRANLIGAAVALVLFSICTFWPAMLIVAGITIFVLTNVARANIAELLPTASFLFYAVSYALFTLAWIGYVRITKGSKLSLSRWLLNVSAAPIALLAVVELSSLVLGRYFGPHRLIISLAAIAVMLFVHLAVTYISRSSAAKTVSD